jgi:hypothetical protein
MIKVRILTGVTAAGAAALSVPSLVGCSTDAQDDLAQGTENNTESIAGSGVFQLNYYALNYRSTSGGDEFIRVNRSTPSRPIRPS